MKYSQKTIKSHKSKIILDLFMCALVIISLATIPLYFLEIDPSLMKVIETIEISVSIIFLSEFLVRMYVSKSKITYMKNYWWLIPAALPIPSALGSILNAFRFLGLVKLVRVLDHYEYEKLYSKHAGS